MINYINDILGIISRFLHNVILKAINIKIIFHRFFLFLCKSSHEHKIRGCYNLQSNSEAIAFPSLPS